MHCDFSQFINIVTEFQILTKDSVTVAVDAVIYSRIFHPTMSVCNVEDASRSTRLLAATTLRNVLGTKNMSEILSDRDSISNQMQVSNYDFFWPFSVGVYSISSGVAFRMQWKKLLPVYFCSYELNRLLHPKMKGGGGGGGG